MRTPPHTLTQAAVLLAAAVVVGIAVNLARPRPIPFGDLPAFEMPTLISVSRALKALEAGDCLFVDARPEEASRQGRVLNALPLPFKTSEKHIREQIPMPHPYRMLIVYCEDEHCDAADAMARRLKRLGYDRLFVLQGGWRAWKESNLPSE